MSLLFVRRQHKYIPVVLKQKHGYIIVICIQENEYIPIVFTKKQEYILVICVQEQEYNPVF